MFWNSKTRVPVCPEASASTTMSGSTKATVQHCAQAAVPECSKTTVQVTFFREILTNFLISFSLVLLLHKIVAGFPDSKKSSSVEISHASSVPPPTPPSVKRLPMKNVFLSASQSIGVRSVQGLHLWAPSQVDLKQVIPMDRVDQVDQAPLYLEAILVQSKEVLVSESLIVMLVHHQFLVNQLLVIQVRL